MHKNPKPIEKYLYADYGPNVHESPDKNRTLFKRPMCVDHHLCNALSFPVFLSCHSSEIGNPGRSVNMPKKKSPLPVPHIRGPNRSPLAHQSMTLGTRPIAPYTSLLFQNTGLVFHFTVGAFCTFCPRSNRSLIIVARDTITIIGLKKSIGTSFPDTFSILHFPFRTFCTF